jgi:hypothetical protein
LAAGWLLLLDGWLLLLTWLAEEGELSSVFPPEKLLLLLPFER